MQRIQPHSPPNQTDRFRGCLLGLACGDAVGTTVEFMRRGTFKPLTDMVGGGPFNLKPGQWTDDTSMALCLADSLIECGGFDAHDQMRRYIRWWREGYLSSNGRCFDIGITVSGALSRYERDSSDPYCGSTDPHRAGNGCLMRLAPIPMFFCDLAEVGQYAELSAKTTHGAAECLAASALFARMLVRALSGTDDKAEILQGDADPFTGRDDVSARIRGIAKGDYFSFPEGRIRGSGYVVDCLEAALWCFWQTDSFEAAVLKAANLGDDADTTACCVGQIAGAFYGESALPRPWLDRLAMADQIRQMADKLIR